MLPYATLVILLPITVVINNQNQKRNNMRLFLWFAAAILLYTLHGGFTADFNSYSGFFMQYASYSFEDLKGILTFEYHLNVLELGYVLLNFLVSRFTKQYVYMQLVQALIICIPVYKIFKESRIPILSVALFISIGPYLESFSTVRNLMAASICCLAYRYVKEENKYKYFATIIIASLIHLSALIMLPFYYVLRIKPSKSNVLKYVFATVIGIVLMDRLAILYNNFFKVSTDLQETLNLLYRSQTDVKLVLIPVGICIATIILFFMYTDKRKKEILSNEEKILFNGTIIWCLLKILMLFSSYTTRFAAYFFYFVCLLCPYVIKKIQGKNLRIIVLIILIGGCCIYYLITSKAYGDYFTLFQDSIILN